MNLREITIGRSKNCDIYLDPRCQYASSMHGTIYFDGRQLMYRDTSTNGTMINNVSVRKRAVPINRGDIIMIAGKYQLNWNQIDSFFSNGYRQQPSPMNDMSFRPVASATSYQPQVSQATPNLSKWSWGAFALSGIWGLFNGCWWMFVINIGMFILALFTWWIPFAIFFYSLIGLGLSILYGVKGTEWAWNNRSWNSAADFEQTQHSWNVAGIVVFCVSIALVLISFLTFAAAIMSIFRF